jgi:hypothetical protein
MCRCELPSPKGVDPELDAVLTTLEASASTVRWNLMLDLGDVTCRHLRFPGRSG